MFYSLNCIPKQQIYSLYLIEFWLERSFVASAYYLPDDLERSLFSERGSSWIGPYSDVMSFFLINKIKIINKKEKGKNE